MEKQTEKVYNAISKDYTKYKDRFVDKVLENFILENISNKKLNILDVGCSIGRFSIPFVKKQNVNLSDISQGMLDEARKLSKKSKLI